MVFLERKCQVRTPHSGLAADLEPAECGQPLQPHLDSSPSPSNRLRIYMLRLLGRFSPLPAQTDSRGGVRNLHQHLIMKAKSLFMFETTYNYHEENFSVQGIIQLKRNTNVFNTLESQPQIIFMTQSVSESHTIQKERKERGPYFTG